MNHLADCFTTEYLHLAEVESRRERHYFAATLPGKASRQHDGTSNFTTEKHNAKTEYATEKDSKAQQQNDC